MTASVIYLQHALVPSKRRVDHVAPRSIRSLAPDWRRPHIAVLNGQAVLRRDWDRQLHHGETLAFIDVEAIPQGGGKGGSNPLQMILMMAVMMFAPMAGLYIAGNLGMDFAAGSMLESAIGIGSTMAGMMLVNALIPPPKLTSPQQAAALAAPSPTYNLQAQGNAARLEAAIPEHFGRMLAYPDYAAQPYQEYAGNEQYLYQLFCIGRGQFDIEAIRIEDTPISSFAEITYEIIPPGGALTLFPANVVSATEVSGQDLPCIAGTYARSGSTVTVTATAHGLATGSTVYLDFTSGGALDGTYTVVTAPTVDTFTVTTAASGTIAAGSTCTVSTWVGPFTANAAATQANFLGVDFVLPRGLYHADATTGALDMISLAAVVEARTVDDSGTVFGAWFTLTAPSYSAATTTPQRYSERNNISPARYQVRARRIDVEQTDTAYGHDIAWAGLRAYLPDSRTYGDVTLLAMRMRASNNLSMQASRKVNVIATRKIPTWNGTAWSANTATRSIAWPIVYVCKQIGLTDAQIDLPALLALDATWSARDDHFDARFDNFISFWEAVSKIAAAGRAKTFQQAGIVRIMRDQAQTLPVQLYSMRNIARGSFSVDYLMPTADTADAIDVGYFDATNWAPRRVRAKLPGSTAARAAKVELFGVTNRDHAFREGMYQAASNRYRRKLIKFSTEMEGFIPSFGDLIAVQHDMPAWGQGGEVVAADVSESIAPVSAWMTVGVSAPTSGSIGPDGVTYGAIVTDASTSVYGYIYSPEEAVISGNAYTQSFFVRKDAISSRFVTIRTDRYASGGGGTPQYTYANVDTSTGAFNQIVTAGDSVSVESWGAWWKITIIAVVLGSNDRLMYRFYPGAGASHWTLSVAATGSAELWTGTFETLTLSEPLTWGSGTHYIALRKRDGSVYGPYACYPGPLPNQVCIPGVPGFESYTGGTEERTHYAFGWADTWRQPARVIAVRPRGLYSAEIEAINEDANVHTAETGEIAPTIQTSQLAGYTNAPSILGLSTRSMPAAPEKMLLTWQPSPWADYYIIEQSSDGQTWTRTGETSTSNYTATALYGSATILRVAAVGIAKGPWVQINYGSSADYMWSAVDTTAMWNADSSTKMWRY